MSKRKNANAKYTVLETGFEKSVSQSECMKLFKNYLKGINNKDKNDKELLTTYKSLFLKTMIEILIFSSHNYVHGGGTDLNAYLNSALEIFDEVKDSYIVYFVEVFNNGVDELEEKHDMKKLIVYLNDFAIDFANYFCGAIEHSDILNPSLTKEEYRNILSTFGMKSCNA